MPSSFESIKHFKPVEFDSPDIKGSGANMQAIFIAKLDLARTIANIPFRINSGYRTPKQNKKVGGVADSSHLKGEASDIAAETTAQKFIIVVALLKAGFVRIGIGKNFVHADNDMSKPQNVLWTY